MEEPMGYDDVLDARRGLNLSYSWRSLWGAKSLLLEGLSWRVEDGKKHQGMGGCVAWWKQSNDRAPFQ